MCAFWPTYVLKGQCHEIFNILSGPPYKKAKTALRTFSFSQRYLITMFQKQNFTFGNLQLLGNFWVFLIECQQYENFPFPRKLFSLTEAKNFANFSHLYRI